MPDRILILLAALLLPAALAAADLPGRLDRALAKVPPGGRAAVAVFDLTARGWLYRANIDEPLSLASTTKLITASAALLALGADHRFTTRLVALGPVVDGVLPGLGVIGGGDPGLGAHLNGGRPERPFEDWAAQLRAAGIVRIDGDLVIDGGLFQGPIRPATWPQDAENQQRWYSAPSSAFAWNDNCIEVRAVPAAPGQPARIEIRPQSPRITVRNLTRTVAEGKSSTVVSRERGGNAITVSGTCSKPTAWFPVAIHNAPDLLAGDQFAATLARAGIPVAGQVRAGPVPAGRRVLVEHRQDLLPVLAIMNQRSQNFYAEQVLRMIGLARGGEGSLAAGCAGVLAALAEPLGDTVSEVEVLDGSGLSYGNRASAFALVKLLAAMRQGPHGPAFVASLKSEDWARAKGRVKTGTHAEARSLAGYVDSPGGRVLAFAILLNRGASKDIAWAVGMREQLFRIIAEETP